MNTILSHAQDGNSPKKRCTGPCGRMLPDTTEFFHRNGHKLHPQCKECRSKKGSDHYRQPGVREQRQDYSKNYRAENQEQIRTRKKAYYSQPEVKEHQRIKMQVNRNLPGKHERKISLTREWLKQPEPREKHRAYDRTFQHNRRARIRNAGSHTVAQIQDLLSRQKHKCYYAACGHAKFEKKDGKYIYHIDHIVPVARGGSNDISNIVLTCPSCNQHKSDRLPHEWPEGGRLL